uniref:Uncharacterized protein n=1 Tax=Oryza punctata TaxID=4537 RepID=A0A0E0JTI9_ORYPU
MKPFNQRTHNLLKKEPRYLSALDVTIEKEILLEDEWILFLEHIFKHRMIRQNAMGPSRPCSTQVMLRFFMRYLARALLRQRLRGTVWTDNKVCYNVLNGEYEIKFDDPNRSLFLFLRSLRGRFESLTTIVWVCMVDDPLISKKKLIFRILEKTVSVLSQPQLRISWSSYVQKNVEKHDTGEQNSNKTNEIKEPDESEDSICWVKTDDEEAEIACFFEIMETVRLFWNVSMIGSAS